MRVPHLLAAAAALLSATTALADPDYRYRPQDRRDPFATYMSSVAFNPAEPCEGLACIDAEKLKVTALLTDIASPRALVEDADGRGFTVRVGDTIGSRRVVAITRDGLRLVSPTRTPRGVVSGGSFVLPMQRRG